MRRGTILACASLLACVVGLLPIGAPTASAEPPEGACTNPEPGRDVVRELPWAQQYLDPERAWQFSRGEGVTVAVLDSGVDADHKQLRASGKVRDGRDFFLVGSLPGNYDCVSHGTAVAGIIAADKMPGVGLQGIAPDVTILPVRITDRETTDNGDTRVIDPKVLARGIRYAADEGADVINLSLSGLQDHNQVAKAIRYAQSKDALVVAAVGNSQDNSDGGNGLPSYPAAYEGVLGVGSIDIAGKRSNNSQVGSYVDLTAPGEGVLGTTRVSGHAYFDGTSFATPFVSATAALVRSAWPSLDAEEVAERLRATATPAPGGSGSQAYGAGVVDPYRAVTEDLGDDPRQLPEAVRPKPDPEHVAEVAWWWDADQRARTIGLLVLGGAATALILGIAIVVGWRRRWRPARTHVTRDSHGAGAEPPPNRLFEHQTRPEQDSPEQSSNPIEPRSGAGPGLFD